MLANREKSGCESSLSRRMVESKKGLLEERQNKPNPDPKVLASKPKLHAGGTNTTSEPHRMQLQGPKLPANIS